jgi:hypothetical protein
VPGARPCDLRRVLHGGRGRRRGTRAPRGRGRRRERGGRRADEESAYLALSSLSYGYYRLAQRAAENQDADPEITARLARWNELLARAYRASPDDERYRAAVKQAALDLHERAPIDLPCAGSQGARSCRSTEDVLREIEAASDRVGIRGALAGLLRRMFGGEP